MINANVETKNIQLQKSHWHIQVTWMEKTSKNVSSSTRIVIPLSSRGNKVIRSRLTNFQMCTSLSSYSSLHKVYQHYYIIT